MQTTQEFVTMPDALSTHVEFRFREQFKNSLSEKKGLMFYCNGQSFPGLVVAVEENVVILRNQEFDRIVVRIDRIDAVASY